jgi:hypothetical protein
MLIYLKSVRHVKQMNRRVTPANTFYRSRRELKMVRQIVMLFIGVAPIGVPYTIFILISVFTIPPKYHFRIAYIFMYRSTQNVHNETNKTTTKCGGSKSNIK